jgi:hypothetical protein
MKVVIDRQVERLTRDVQEGRFRSEQIKVGNAMLYARERVGMVRVTPDHTQPGGYMFRPVAKMRTETAPWPIWTAFYLVGKPVLWLRAVRERLRG